MKGIQLSTVQITALKAGAEKLWIPLNIDLSERQKQSKDFGVDMFYKQLLNRTLLSNQVSSTLYRKSSTKKNLCLTLHTL